MKNFLFIALALISLQAFGQRVEIEKATKSFKVNASTTNVDLRFDIPVYRIDERVVQETVSCRVPQCSNDQGDGSEGQWNNFFNVPKGQKAAALAASIKGIGKVTAERIVDNNLFTYKPKSWSAFKSLISKIQNQLEGLGYKYQIYNNVVEVYGYDNMIALGYGNERSCTYVNSYCTQWVTKEFKTFSHHINRNLSVSINNQSLQSFETDTVEITVGTERHDVAISGGYYNKYQGTINRQGNTIDLEASRLLRPVPVNEVAATLLKEDARLVLNVSIPAKYSNEDHGSEMKAIIEFCYANLFGGCHDVMTSTTVKVVNNRVVQPLGSTAFKKGSKYFARVQLVKLNSRYYSSGKSDVIKTESVKY